MIIFVFSKTSFLIAEGSNDFDVSTENLTVNIQILPKSLTTSEDIRLKITPIVKNNLESLENARIDIIACFASCDTESKVQKIKSIALNSPEIPQHYFSLFVIENEGNWELLIKISNKSFSDEFSIPITVIKKANPYNYFSTSMIFLLVFFVLISMSVFITLKSKKNLKSTHPNN